MKRHRYRCDECGFYMHERDLVVRTVTFAKVRGRTLGTRRTGFFCRLCGSEELKRVVERRPHKRLMEYDPLE